jgi:YD repeat-containing protein
MKLVVTPTGLAVVHKMRQLLVLLALLLWGHRVIAQYTPAELTSVPSPSAASLGRFGEVPVSFFTGVANIEVPLYTLQEQGITVPIALRYHASGFRPDQHPGWVGQGWALEAGGVINRIVHDQTDENVAGNGGATGLLFNSNTVRNSHLSSLTEDEQFSFVNAGEGFDTEPDEFNFRVGSYSGSFYWDINTTNWRVKCDKPVTIVALDQTSTGINLLNVPFDPPGEAVGLIQSGGYTPTIRGFILTAEDGTRYTFGNSTNAIEYSVGLFRQLTDRWVANAWYLAKIEKTNGVVVSFAYNPGEFIAQYYKQETQSYVDANTAYWSCTQTVGMSFAYGAEDERSYTGTLIRPTYLATITSDHTKLTFNTIISTELQVKPIPYTTSPPPTAYFYNFYNFRYSQDYPTYGRPPTSWRFLPFLQPGGKRITEDADLLTSVDNLKWRELQTILIERTGGSAIRSIFFKYNNNINERLTLQEVQETGRPAYRFDYNIAAKGYPALPGYMSDNTDHWGFYNNRPIASVQRADYFITREPAKDTVSVLLGILNRITYPTGGVTDFRFEPHTYAQQLDTLRSKLIGPLGGGIQAQAGGVRLRATKSYDLSDIANGIYKEYFYVSNYNAKAINPRNTLPSSGILGGQSQYRYNRKFEGNFHSLKINTRQVAWTCQSVLTGSLNSKGSHIGYSEVVEKRRDGSYTRYKYSNFGPGNFDESGKYLMGTWASQAPYTSAEQVRGNLLAEQVYNSQEQLVKEQNIAYSTINEGPEYVDAVNTAGINFPQCRQGYPFPGNFYIGSLSYYKVKTSSVLPTAITTTLYDTNGRNGVTTTSTTDYNTYRLAVTKTETNSNNETLRTIYRYPFDIKDINNSVPAQPFVDPTTSALSAMTAKNMIGFPIETVTSRNGFITNATVQTYLLNGVNNNIVPYQSFSLETAQPLSQYRNTTANPLVIAGGIPQMRLKATYTQYDAKGNLLGLLKEGGATTSYLWSYQNSLPSAKVENALPNEIFHSSFEDDKMVSDAVPDAANTWYSPGAYLKFEATPSDRPSTRSVAHTGRLAGALYTSTPGEQAHAFSPTLTIAKRALATKYVLSGWIYTNGAQASIWVFPNLPSARRSDGTMDYYQGFSNTARPDLYPLYLNTTPDQAGKWVYFEKEVDVPGDATLLTFRLTNFWSAASNSTITTNGAGVWFDDIRLHPAGAQMTTYTHQPGVGATSTSDVNNRPTFYEYDALERLTLVRDQDGNILKQLDYHYQH